MHLLMQLVTLYPFVLLNNRDDLPPTPFQYVVTYTGAQVVDFNNDLLVAE
jgi:hypothetical protein